MNIILNYFIYLKKVNGDWGLGIGDWGLGIGDWAQSPIPNPQSPIPNPQSPGYFYLKIKFLKLKLFYSSFKIII